MARQSPPRTRPTSTSLMRATSRATAAGVCSTRLTSIKVAGRPRATSGTPRPSRSPSTGHVLDTILLLAGDVVPMDQPLRDDTVADVSLPGHTARGRRFTTVLDGQASRRSAGNVPDQEGR